MIVAIGEFACFFADSLFYYDIFLPVNLSWVGSIHREIITETASIKRGKGIIYFSVSSSTSGKFTSFEYFSARATLIISASDNRRYLLWKKAKTSFSSGVLFNLICDIYYL